MKSRTMRFSVLRRDTRCVFLPSSPSVTTTPDKFAAKCRVIIVMLATNSGACFCGAHFRMRQAWRFTARYRNFGTHVEEGLAGRFESRPGGGKRWLEFRTAWQSVIQFRGRVTSSGFACLRLANVGLFSTRREGALCDSAGAISSRY